MSDDKEIIERLTRIETLQEATEAQNRAEHQQIMAAIQELKDDDLRARTTNGTQNDRLTELETAFEAHVEEEQHERSAFMWRFGLFVTLLVFGGDLLTKFLRL